MKRKKQQSQTPQPIFAHYEWDGFDYRWWQVGDPGDVFDLLTEEQLRERLSQASSFNRRVVEGMPEESAPDTVREPCSSV